MGVSGQRSDAQPGDEAREGRCSPTPGQDAELGQAHPDEQLIQATERPGRAAREEKIEGLGQRPPGHHQQGERHHAADGKRRAPPKARYGERGQRAAERRADRVPGRVGRERGAAPAVGCVLGHEHRDARNRAADADAGQRTQREQLAETARRHRAEHAGSGNQDGHEDDSAPAENVGARREEERACGHADEPRAEELSELRIRQVPCGLDARGRERHRQDVEAVEHVEGDAERDGERLEGAQRALRHRLSYVVVIHPRRPPHLAAAPGIMMPQTSMRADDPHPERDGDCGERTHSRDPLAQHDRPECRAEHDRGLPDRGNRGHRRARHRPQRQCVRGDRARPAQCGA